MLELPTAIPELTKEEFRFFQELVLNESGIHLGAKNRAMLISRLWKRLRALDLSSFSAYYRLVKKDSAEMVHMLDCICTNETHFFREPNAFDCLRERVFPEWITAANEGKRGRTIRAWSAACSTGDEPYSLAMTLLTHFPEETGWKIEVLGTDLSTKVLARASAGIWSADKISTVPAEYQRRFFLKGFGPDKGKYKAADELRRVVRFQRMNLNQANYEIFGPFDLIFCRNVIIYFQWETKLRVINQLGSHLAPHGYLFLGHAESVHGVSEKLESVMPKVFRSTDGKIRSTYCILQRRNMARRSPESVHDSEDS
ncbi:MAG TPA: protein-glutamate O-methyltransferase CheR [Candidatus Eremiobacteraceae bacterium]|nr:protein-glutamate O-methyltransferase CheR [Candidatus Eremiobacteraceae bacterium]